MVPSRVRFLRPGIHLLRRSEECDEGGCAIRSNELLLELYGTSPSAGVAGGENNYPVRVALGPIVSSIRGRESIHVLIATSDSSTIVGLFVLVGLTEENITCIVCCLSTA